MDVVDQAVLKAYIETTMYGAGALKGDKGEKGDTGSPGPPGPQGEQGLQGIQGIKGDTGAPGAIGPQGIQGPKGDTGETGAQGPQGIQGVKGEKGDGFAIIKLYSSKETLLSDLSPVTNGQMVAVINNGNADVYLRNKEAILNTETGDLDGYSYVTNLADASTIQGPPGEKGEQGLRGIQGEKGEKGDTGPQGVKGEKGDQGIQGPQGIQGERGPAGSDASVKINNTLVSTATDEALSANMGTELKKQFDAYDTCENYTSMIEQEEVVKYIYTTTLLKLHNRIASFMMNITFKEKDSYTIKLGTLPEGCRPYKSVAHNTVSNNGIPCYAYINADGTFGVTRCDSSTSWKEDGIRVLFLFITSLEGTAVNEQ